MSSERPDKTASAPRVSVVMATYNCGRFIAEQLDSLKNQLRAPFELIIGDDGSTDDTLAIVDEFRRTASFPVSVSRNEARLGYGGNFLNAAKKASGAYIAFCDQDDIWLPNKLVAAVDALERHHADLHVHRAVLIDAAGREIGALNQNITGQRVFAPLELAPWGVFYGFTMVFRRSLLEIAGAERRGNHTFDHHGLLSHDLWIYFLASSLGRVITDDRRLAKYRQHANNVTPHAISTPLTTLKKHLGAAWQIKLRRDEIAVGRADLLAEISQTSRNAEIQTRAANASDYWRRIARFEEMRTSLYTAPTARERATDLARLMSARAYAAPPQGGLGAQLMVRDALAGVLQLSNRQGQ